jgi:sec-independent protein translocase protein TatB
MFDIGWGELVVIGIVALIAIGPKELPTVLRTVGQWMGKIRRMASEFQGQFQEAMREAEFADLKKQVDSIGDMTRDLPTSFDPLETARKEIEGAAADKPPVSDSNAAGAATAGPDTGPAPAALADSNAAGPLPQPEMVPPASEEHFNPDQPNPPAVTAGEGRAA